MQVCKYASMQVCKYASMQVCKYASMQVYTYMQINAKLSICPQLRHFQSQHGTETSDAGKNLNKMGPSSAEK